MTLFGIVLSVVAVACIAWMVFHTPQQQSNTESRRLGASFIEFPYGIDEMLSPTYEKVRSRNSQLFSAVSEALFAHDPIGINYGFNTDEYDAEAGAITPKLERCKSFEQVVTVLHEEFVKWFGAEAAGGRDRYLELAKDLWIPHQLQRQFGAVSAAPTNPQSLLPAQ